MIADDVRPLKESRSVGKALAHEDRVMLLRIVATRPDWQVARCAAIVALNTTMPRRTERAEAARYQLARPSAHGSP